MLQKSGKISFQDSIRTTRKREIARSVSTGYRRAVEQITSVPKGMTNVVCLIALAECRKVNDNSECCLITVSHLASQLSIADTSNQAFAIASQARGAKVPTWKVACFVDSSTFYIIFYFKTSRLLSAGVNRHKNSTVTQIKY